MLNNHETTKKYQKNNNSSIWTCSQASLKKDFFDFFGDFKAWKSVEINKILKFLFFHPKAFRIYYS